MVSMQVTLLASGLLMYHGTAAGMVPWLSGQLGYCYDPLRHGLASDWALDLVVVEFNKPRVGSSHCWWAACPQSALYILALPKPWVVKFNAKHFGGLPRNGCSGSASRCQLPKGHFDCHAKIGHAMTSD